MADRDGDRGGLTLVFADLAVLAGAVAGWAAVRVRIDSIVEVPSWPGGASERACWLAGPEAPAGRKQPVQHFIASYGIAAVFLLMLAESACIPVPSEVIMLLGGALAAGAVAGAHPNLVLIIIAGVAGNVVGSYVAWAVGRFWGQAAVRRWGRRVGVREHDIDRATDWFDRHGPAAVFFGRLVPVVRTFISLPAGFAAMAPVRFGLYTTLGCIPWTTGLAIAGYYLGSNWQSVANGFHGPTYIIAAVIAAALIAAVIIHLRRRKAGAHAAGYEQDRPREGQPR